MTYLTPREQSLRWRHTLLIAFLLALSLLILSLLDKQLWQLLLLDPDKSLENKDWWQLLRQFGSLILWIIIAALFILHDHARKRPGAWHRGLMIVLAAAIAGALAEALKGIVGRARPLTTGEYHFKWLEPHEHLPGGLASSHTAVAFGGAIMLSWFMPMWRVPLMILAFLCAMTRLIVGAHFVTDVYVAILLAWLTCLALWKCFSANMGGENHPLTPK